MKDLRLYKINEKNEIKLTECLSDNLNENGLTIKYYDKYNLIYYINNDLLIRKFKLSKLSDDIQLNKYEEIIFKIFKNSKVIIEDEYDEFFYNIMYDNIK